MDEIQSYFLAGFENKEMEVKPIWSSTCWFAYESGLWCKKNGIEAKTFKMSRGYSTRINGKIILEFGENLTERKVKES